MKNFTIATITAAGAPTTAGIGIAIGGGMIVGIMIADEVIRTAGIGIGATGIAAAIAVDLDFSH